MINETTVGEDQKPRDGSLKEVAYGGDMGGESQATQGANINRLTLSEPDYRRLRDAEKAMYAYGFPSAESIRRQAHVTTNRAQELHELAALLEDPIVVKALRAQKLMSKHHPLL